MFMAKIVFMETYSIIAFLLINPYKPSVLFVGHLQTVQNQIIRRKMRRLIRFSTVCLQKFLLKFRLKWVNCRALPKKMEQKWVIILPPVFLCQFFLINGNFVNNNLPHLTYIYLRQAKTL